MAEIDLTQGEVAARGAMEKDQMRRFTPLIVGAGRPRRTPTVVDDP